MAGPLKGRPFLFTDSIRSRISWFVNPVASESRRNVLSAAATNLIQLVLVHFSAKRVAVYSEDFCGAGLVPVESLENAPYELFLELRQRFFEQDTSLDHRAHQRLQLLFHFSVLRRGARRGDVVQGLNLLRES